jgi:hypothetical protein
MVGDELRVLFNSSSRRRFQVRHHNQRVFYFFARGFEFAQPLFVVVNSPAAVWFCHFDRQLLGRFESCKNFGNGGAERRTHLVGLAVNAHRVRFRRMSGFRHRRQDTFSFNQLVPESFDVWQ